MGVFDNDNFFLAGFRHIIAIVVAPAVVFIVVVIVSIIVFFTLYIFRRKSG